MYGIGELEAVHREVGTPIFNTMYQSEPGGLEGEIVSRAFFRYGYAPKHSVPYMVVDPAIGKKLSSDETAIVVANVVPYSPMSGEPFLYVRWVWHKRGSREREKRDIIRQAWEHYRPVQIGIEEVAYQAALTDLLEEDHPDLPIVPVRPDKDKFTRFLALGALYEFGRIVHHPYLRASYAEDQLVHLPTGKHDDIADCIAYLSTMAGVSAAISVDHRPPGFR